MTLPRFAILISGRGSNMSALLAARDQIPAEFVLVVSDQANAPGLLAARDQGIAVAVVEKEKGQTKEAHEAALIDVLAEAGATHIALAGYMRLLSGAFLDQFAATVNIHPSLLPAFPGLDTHARALAAGKKSHGCSVHQVDSGMDTGAIIAQAGLDVRDDDTPQSLAARLLLLEHALYPVALHNFLSGKQQNQVLAERDARG